jgi:hypothetical protein
MVALYADNICMVNPSLHTFTLARLSLVGHTIPKPLERLKETVQRLRLAYRAQSGLPDGLFSNQNTNLGKFWRVLEWKMLVYFMTIWYV